MKEEKSEIVKYYKFAKSHPKISEIVNKFSDWEALQAKKTILNDINARISELRKDRNREINRKIQLEELISELNSLNQELKVGRVICADCRSERVVFTNKEFTFDVSNKYVRNKIMESINEQIQIKEEIIEEKTRNINNNQDQLKNELEIIPKSYKTILLHSEEIQSSTEIDRKLTEIEEKIEESNRTLKESRRVVDEGKLVNKNVISDILTMMNSIYKELDPNGTLIFDELFTKKGETYSGSEEQEFYFVKLIALSKVLDLEYPIIIDSFRDGEISSEKEKFMIAAYSSLDKQVILSSTLKIEEYSNSRYSEFPFVTAIDYSTNNTSHILNNDEAPEFIEILKEFNIEPN